MVHKLKKEKLQMIRKLDENQKKNRLYELLMEKWSKGEKILYKGRPYFVGKQGGVSGINSFIIETERVYNLPETATYTLGRGAYMVAENDKDVSDWEMSKEILLSENE